MNNSWQHSDLIHTKNFFGKFLQLVNVPLKLVCPSFFYPVYIGHICLSLFRPWIVSGKSTSKVCHDLWNWVSNNCYALRNMWRNMGMLPLLLRGIGNVCHLVYALTLKQRETHGCVVSTVATETPGHQYTQCWLNSHCIGPVSYKNNTLMVNNITK